MTPPLPLCQDCGHLVAAAGPPRWSDPPRCRNCSWLASRPAAAAWRDALRERQPVPAIPPPRPRL